VVICLERGADLHTAQLMPLPLTVSCFSIIQICFTFLVPAHPGSPGQRAVKQVCVCSSVIFLSNTVVCADSHSSVSIRVLELCAFVPFSCTDVSVYIVQVLPELICGC